MDVATKTAAKYKIPGYPYLALFKNGEQADAILGIPGDTLEAAKEEIEKKMLALK